MLLVALHESRDLVISAEMANPCTHVPSQTRKLFAIDKKNISTQQPVKSAANDKPLP